MSSIEQPLPGDILAGKSVVQVASMVNSCGIAGSNRTFLGWGYIESRLQVDLPGDAVNVT